MVLFVSATVLVHALGGASLGQPRFFAAVFLTQSASSGQSRDVQLLELSSVRRLFTSLAHQRVSMAEGERVAAWAEFALLVEAVSGDGIVGTLPFDDLARAEATANGPRVLARPDVIARDAAAYNLLALGYSARETADVVSGRIGQGALDIARKMLMVGRGHDAAANYLDSQYKRVQALRTPSKVPLADMRGGSPNPFNAAIEKYAAQHGVDTSLVRAVIAVESAFDPGARSPAGAIGLMQLMPATARALGVDPSMPDQNIEGGVRYLSELLDMFGGVELALIAYNGGPGFARRYARGEAALYGETREYVKQVMMRVNNLVR